MSLHSWLRVLTANLQRPGRTRDGVTQHARTAGFRPRLEALEDRRVPAVLPVFRLGDNVGERGTLRWAVSHAQSGDTIGILPALTSPIVLTQGELLVNTWDLTIKPLNPQAHAVTIDGGGNSSVFD